MNEKPMIAVIICIALTVCVIAGCITLYNIRANDNYTTNGYSEGSVPGLGVAVWRLPEKTRTTPAKNTKETK